MEQIKQSKKDQQPVVSPLANDKTYGERWYNAVFDWGLNYWTNLLSSAGFSQYVEHGTAPVKLPFMKEAASPRDLQQTLAESIRKHDPFMQSFERKMFAEKPQLEALEAVANRSMARARSLTLLMPGFFVVIPTVWLGAKIKPWFVKTLNKAHYGAEAMDDPTLQARHQALEAEARPTFLGAFTGRMGTFFAAQATAQLIGSRQNIVNKYGKNNKYLSKFAIDPLTEGIGEKLGGAMPDELKNAYNEFAGKHGLDWSQAQIKQKQYLHVNEETQKLEIMPYNTATQDLGRFIAADTFYTMVTALTIRPVLKILTYIPGMSYKKKMPANAATFDGDTIKVPANHYADRADIVPNAEIVTPQLDRALENTPSLKVSEVRDHIAPARLETQIA